MLLQPRVVLQTEVNSEPVDPRLSQPTSLLSCRLNRRNPFNAQGSYLKSSLCLAHKPSLTDVTIPSACELELEEEELESSRTIPQSPLKPPQSGRGCEIGREIESRNSGIRFDTDK